LSQATVDSKHVVTHIDGAQLLEKLNDRIEKLGASTPRMLEPVIEAVPDDEDEDRAGGEAAPDEPV
jgi:hypothetical protein